MRRSAFIALLCAAACGHGLGEQPCSASSDCPSPQTCVAGRCASQGFCIGSAACNDDSACATGQHCANGCCQAGVAGTCARDADCSSHPKTPVCDTGKGACVACLTARDCGRGALCQNGSCVALPGCASNADCFKPTPICDSQLRSCVECLGSSDCLDLSKPVCDASHTCVALQACTADGDCQAPTPRCLVSGGRCVACIADTDCVAPQVCDSVQNICLQPAATSCTTDTDCASNPKAPHCKPGSGGKPGVCVECLGSNQCPAGFSCSSSSNTCVQTTCASDVDCQAPTAKCDTVDTPHVCVACLTATDCPSGDTCQPDHTCAAGTAGCTSDSQCTKNPAVPVCDTTTGECVQCTAKDDPCGAGKTCSPQDTCITAACKSDGDCTASPATPHCDTVSGACVQCTSTGQCASGYTCVSDACKPVCTTNADCQTPTPVCRVSPFPQCVQCLTSSDCSGGFTCNSSNVCVAPTGCTNNANCPPANPFCLTGNCVQCGADSDCKNGEGCSSANTCTVTGGSGQICSPGNVCNAGLLCINQGGAFGPVCLPQCSPYASSCASGTVCEWFGFDASGAFEGFCTSPNGHGAVGAACDQNAVDSCEWNLICAPTSASTGVCRSMCDPTQSGNCGSDVCNAVLGAISSARTQETFGYCGPASKWGATCLGDTRSGGPDCGSAVPSTSVADLYCAPSFLIAENPQSSVLGLCTFTPAAATAVGGAGDSCAAHTDNDCRTGVCLSDGPVTCFSGCTFVADCTRDCIDNHGGSSCPGLRPVKCVDLDFFTTKDNIVPSCEPTCLDDADCAALAGAQGRACVPSPSHSSQPYWYAFCSPVTGTGAAGATCTGGGDCASGICFTAATLQAIELQQQVSGFTATDGFCLGSADQPSDCNAPGTEFSIDAALPLAPPTVQGVMGHPNPGVCWPIENGCTSDSDCDGLSADVNTPRVCAPYKTTTSGTTQSQSCSSDAVCASVCNSSANNPNPGNVYGATGGIYGPNGYCRQETWALECAPSLGAAKGGPGAACVHSTDCRTGQCLQPATVSDCSAGGCYCFGSCGTDADCNGTHCTGSGYLGMSSSYCQP